MKHARLHLYLLLSCICFMSFASRAQYVSIPDSNFGYWLNYNGYATAMTGNNISGWQLNISDSLVVNATEIICTYANISDLTGIENFINLTGLGCDGNLLTTGLPMLPNSLIGLSCTGCGLDSIGTLPPGLVNLQCDYNNLTSLSGLPNSIELLTCEQNNIGFITPLPDSLQRLDCYSNQLTSLPALPQRVYYLNCGANLLHTLPAMPSTLTLLACDENPLYTLPALPALLQSLSCTSDSLAALPVLPLSLTDINCSSNLLTSLPALPLTLTSLICNDNPLSGGLPALPASMTQLECSFDRLSALPALPDSMTSLSCNNNFLINLPTLPPALFTLMCNNNPSLMTLPALPARLNSLNVENDSLATLPLLPVLLQELDCSYNQLTSLPTLPTWLTGLYCGFNHLIGLPELPASIWQLDCSGNPSLRCLPRVPDSTMSTLYISGCDIRCMPNRFTGPTCDFLPDTMPLCDATSGCDFFYNIAGSVHYDTSSTCAQDSLAPGAVITGMKVQLKQGGTVVGQFYTSSSGSYSFKAPVPGSYTVELDTTDLPLSIACPQSASRSISLTLSDSVRKYENFGMQCSSSDFGIQYIEFSRLRPTFTSLVNISAGNVAQLKYNARCASGTAGIVTTSIGGAVHYIGPAPGALTPTSVSGLTLTYIIADLDSLDSHSLDVQLTTDTGAVAGTDVCITTVISPSVTDANPSDDTLTQCATIVNSWDPNLKEVSPASLPADGGWLTYTIHFQNTGSDTAYTVVVRDTLSQNVDAASFQYIASSHTAVVQLTGQAMAFTFPKINLVDSATNPPLSEGWIQYKVKTKPNLPLQTQVRNTAYIYFDFNVAVVTNTATSTIEPLGINNLTANTHIHLYPNPNSGTFTLQTSNAKNSNYIITDMLGNIITEKAITSDAQAIDMHEAAAGVYTLSVKDGQRSRQLRFTIVK